MGLWGFGKFRLGGVGGGLMGSESVNFVYSVGKNLFGGDWFNFDWVICLWSFWLFVWSGYVLWKFWFFGSDEFGLVFWFVGIINFWWSGFIRVLG